MKHLLVTILSISTFSISANDSFINTTDFLKELNSVIEEVTNPPQEPCIDCKVEDNLISQGDPLPTEYKKNALYFSKKCESFIKADGTLGDWGRMIYDYIEETEVQKDMFLYDEIKGMTARPYTCPNWYNLNEEQRKRFWVWMFASIAQVESSCDPVQVNNGIVPDATDRPTGLFQLNQQKSARQWRGPNCKFPSGHTETIKVKNQIRCSMDIMFDILLAKKGIYRANGKIFPTNSYWEKLRGNHSQTGGPIGELVRNYPPCNATP